jgi:hypothetical protein
MAAALKKSAAINVQTRLGKYIKRIIIGIAPILHNVNVLGLLNVFFNLLLNGMMCLGLQRDG